MNTRKRVEETTQKMLIFHLYYNFPNGIVENIKKSVVKQTRVLIKSHKFE